MRIMTLTMTSREKTLVIDKAFAADISNTHRSFREEERAASFLSQLCQIDTLVRRARPAGPRLVAI